MKAARFYDKGDIRIEDIPEPTVAPGTVGINVAWCGICGTDLHEFMEGPIFIPPCGHPHPISGESAPVTMGHEFSGVVYAVGEGVDVAGLQGVELVEAARAVGGGDGPGCDHPRAETRRGGRAARTALRKPRATARAMSTSVTFCRPDQAGIELTSRTRKPPSPSSTRSTPV